MEQFVKETISYANKMRDSQGQLPAANFISDIRHEILCSAHHPSAKKRDRAYKTNEESVRLIQQARTIGSTYFTEQKDIYTITAPLANLEYALKGKID